MRCLKNMIPVEQSVFAVKNRTRSHDNSYINCEPGGGTKLTNTHGGVTEHLPQSLRARYLWELPARRSQLGPETEWQK